MTGNEWIQSFKDSFGEASTYSWTNAEIARRLRESVRRITRKYKTYGLDQAVVVQEKQNLHDLSTILPVLLSNDEKILDLYSVRYQKCASGSITAIARLGGAGTAAALFATSSTSEMSNGDKIELFNLSSGNYNNGIFKSYVWNDTGFMVAPIVGATTGTVTSVTDGTPNAQFVDATHGLEDNDAIYLTSDVYASGMYKINQVDADTFECIDSDGDTLAYISTDTPTWIKMTQYDTATDTGVWADNSNYTRYDLNQVKYEFAQSLPWNVIQPNETRPPAGILICHWVCSGDLALDTDDSIIADTDDFSQTIIPEALQQAVPDLAAALAFTAGGDERLGAFKSLALDDIVTSLAQYGNEKHPPRPVYTAMSWKMQAGGMYGFRHQDTNALIIFPRQW